MVATPIGNLEDISRRAANVLSTVQIIAAEDTRRTRVLLQHLGVQDGSGGNRELVSLHEHNEDKASPYLLKRIQEGADVALVSDAGTPLINDPGYLLIKLAAAKGVQTLPVPGASALTALLSVCPLPCHPFRFIGFLPTKRQARKKLLAAAIAQPEAMIFLESPKRIRGTLETMAELGTRRVMLGREMTKQYETFYVGPAAEVLSQLADAPKGEFIGLLEAQEISTDQAAAESVLHALLQELSPSQAARLAAQISGGNKQDLYRKALEIQE